jgi:hypothetical protein
MAPRLMAGLGTVGAMTAQPMSTPSPGPPYGVIKLGEDAAAAADVAAVVAAHRDWVASGRPGAVPHELAMAELLGGR